MKFSGSRFVNFVICGLLLANAVLTISVARYGSSLRGYRSEIASLAADVYNYASASETRFSTLESNVVERVSSLQRTGGEVDPRDSASFLKTIGSLPYRYCVVRGVPGISSGSFVFYPLGSETAYGMITAVGCDFVEFDGLRRYVLAPEVDREPRTFGI